MENKKFALLSEDELEGVSGGAFKVDTSSYTCEDFVCCWCKLPQSELTPGSHACEAQLDPNCCDETGKIDSSALAVFDNVCHWCYNTATCSRIR